MTSSMVRLPMMITGRTWGMLGYFLTLYPSLWRDFLVSQVQVDATAPVVQERADVPQHARGHHAEHELHRQVRGHGELGADRLVRDEQHQQGAERDHAAGAGQRHRRY